MGTESNRRTAFSEPVTIPPRGPGHTHTLILLHGRGGNALTFGPPFLCTPPPQKNGKLLPKRFPTVKFVFPGAAMWRSIAEGRSAVSQWFDACKLRELEKMEEVQYEGIRASSAWLRSIIEAEAKVLENSLNLGPGLGRGRVVLGGLSQGCAMGLCMIVSGFLDERTDCGDATALAGFVGMAGWLPFCKHLEKFAAGQEPQHDNNLNEAADSAVSAPASVNAMNYFREVIMDLPQLPSADLSIPVSLKIPIWLGHGALDPVVPPEFSRHATSTLQSLGWDVTLAEYGSLNHWYSAAQVEDMAIFLRDQVGVPEAR